MAARGGGGSHPAPASPPAHRLDALRPNRVLNPFCQGEEEEEMEEEEEEMEEEAVPWGSAKG